MSELFSILLIDDEPDVAYILKQAAINSFPEANFIYASNYKEAVAYLDGIKGRGPRLVLLDLDLQSEWSGFDFLSLLRQHPQGRLIPIVIISSSPKEQDCKEALLRGANTFTKKPFSYVGWKSYITQLRAYWFKTVTVPTLYFDKLS